MVNQQSRAGQKRPLDEDEYDDDSNKPPAPKRVRFPKGKKVKPGDEVVDIRRQPEDDGSSEQTNPHLAAKERAMRRNQMTTELFIEEHSELLPNISAAEVHYGDNETFVDDGIQIEPFNLEREREEGYFDEQGNFVEYMNENEIKDAWLDSVEDVPMLAERSSVRKNVEEDAKDLSSQEIGQMKRRIANVLQPGETVLQALRRLKGTSGSKKEKMSAETKLLFDQLTEDAMKLMENGDYNVYDEKREVFVREAEGYERLALARGEGTSMSLGQGKIESTVANGFASQGMNVAGSSLPSDTILGPSNPNASTSETISNKGDDAYDMFAEDDENATADLSSSGNGLITGLNDGVGQPSESGDLQNDYVYDESSGYYYSSYLGYYYDPSSGLYCCAASGKWYSYNETTGAYDEIHEAAVPDE